MVHAQLESALGYELEGVCQLECAYNVAGTPTGEKVENFIVLRFVLRPHSDINLICIHRRNDAPMRTIGGFTCKQINLLFLYLAQTPHTCMAFSRTTMVGIVGL